MVLPIMIRCLRLAKRGLTFTAVLFFASLLMKELSSSVLPPLAGSKRVERRPSRARSHRAVQPVATQQTAPGSNVSGAVVEAIKDMEEAMELDDVEGDMMGIRGEASLAPPAPGLRTLGASLQATNSTKQALPAHSAIVTHQPRPHTAGGEHTRLLNRSSGEPIRPGVGSYGANESGGMERPAMADTPDNQGASDVVGGAEGPGGVAAGENNFYIVYVTNTATSETIYIHPASEFFKFRIKACSDAYLLYKQKISVSEKFSYHIGFGYGTKTVIWKKLPNPVTTEFRTPKGGRIECERTVSLWVNHVGATFSVGFGPTENKPYLQWTDASNPYTTSSMTLANPWPKKQAIWYLDMSSGSYF